ncbi:MAG TPA: TonB-dependent receptor [Rhodothermales bacterium]|nr:TonB-dependent receptor [Rhodothermales bacterium]
MPQAFQGFVLRLALLAGMVLALSVDAQAQDPSADSTIVMEGELEPIVVTATKGEKELRNVPVPTTLITKDAITAQGATRLADLLAEQPGMHLVYDHGKGIQLQGLASDYTLILIDGEPIIGRVAGTLDLGRLTVAGIERVEVVRGPSSSLYGSEALAGVINIITRKPTQPWATTISSRYETHGTVDLNVEAETTQGSVGARIYANRYSSAGYDLAPDALGQTVPRFTDYTVGGRFDLDASEQTKLNISARGNWQDQSDTVGILEGTEQVPHDNQANQTDWNVSPSIMHRLNNSLKLTGTLYGSRFKTDTQVREPDTGDLQSRTQFDQYYGKGEVQVDAIIGTRHLFTGGGGYIGERVEADRIAGGTRTTANVFAFAQHEWLPTTWADLILSARLDAHTDYATNLSPKLAVLLKPNETWRVRTSVGSGFKAPTFQQLYLDFTNAVAGYSVFGSVDAAAALRQLEEEGQIQAFLLDLDTLEEIKPEQSVSFNVGVEAEPMDNVSAQVNLFRNHVADLIEAAPVALKTNGQSAFTYFNLNRIVTQGVEAKVSYVPIPAVSMALSYQYLDTFDRDVIDQLEAGTLFKRLDERDVRLSRSDYGGLMNRSKHSGTLRLQYHHAPLGFTAALRGLYRGRYGFGDLNGNLILDDDAEYVKGYWLWHLTLTQQIMEQVSVQVGGQNLLDQTKPSLIPSLPGRLLFASLRVEL